MNYFRAQLKRAARSFVPVFVTMLALAAVLGTVCVWQMRSRLGEESRQKLVLGLVGDASDSFFRLGMEVIESMDASRYSLEFVQLKESEARRALEDRRISGYLRIPEDFVESVWNGENEKVTVVVGSSRYSVTTLLVEELARVVSSMITESQTGIYAYTDWARENGAKDPDESVLRLNLKYFDVILPRDGIYQVDTPDSRPSLSLQGYYFSAVFLLFFLFMGLTGASFMIRRDRSLYKLLSARGRGAASQVVSEWGAWCILMAGFFVLVSAAAGAAQGALSAVPELEGLSPAGLIRLFAVMALMLPMLGSLHCFLYQITESLVGAVLLEFCVYLGLSYLAGCFYPLTFFPESIQRASAFLPAGTVMAYVQALLRGEGAAAPALGLLAWTAVFLCGAFVIRRARILRS